MDAKTAFDILRHYVGSFGTIGCEYWSDKDREKATEALDFLEENAEFEEEFEEDSDDDYWWENMF